MASFVGMRVVSRGVHLSCLSSDGKPPSPLDQCANPACPGKGIWGQYSHCLVCIHGRTGQGLAASATTHKCTRPASLTQSDNIKQDQSRFSCTRPSTQKQLWLHQAQHKRQEETQTHPNASWGLIGTDQTNGLLEEL